MNPDRFFELLPAVYRQHDEERGGPLRSLLRVIAEQADVVETDIGRLYENWFIETCEDWVVPYIGELVGYRIAHEAGEPGDTATERQRRRNSILIPRRDVAHTVRHRRRKGALALLEELAADMAGWPARAVEGYRLLAHTQALHHLHPLRGRTADLRDMAALRQLAGPFDRLAHTVDVRRVASDRTPGLYNIPSVALFVWRLRSYPVTRTEAFQLESRDPARFAFSALANETPLFARAVPETDPPRIATEPNLPVRIDRHMLEARRNELYGDDKSFAIHVAMEEDEEPVAVPVEEIVAADLTDWTYRPEPGQVAVDPQLGRIAFPPDSVPQGGVWVSYRYGFSADIGGGEYPRTVSQPAGARLYRVGGDHGYSSINEALAAWRTNDDQHAVIEIAESGLYTEPINIRLGTRRRQSLQLRAADGARAVLRLLDYRASRPDWAKVQGAHDSLFTLDGLLVEGRGFRFTGALSRVVVRHSTLVPGWSLEHEDCAPRHTTEPSLVLDRTPTRLLIEHTVVGCIDVDADELTTEPIGITVNDSVIDSTASTLRALGGRRTPRAHVALSIARSTVLGTLAVRSVDLAENSLFTGRVDVARTQSGCVRFCFVPRDSRTPRRYQCQPDLATGAAAEADKDLAAQRVTPRFASTRYGVPEYCRLDDRGPEEIYRGADDESEMGVFHDLFEPQRAAGLRARLDEYTPAGTDAGVRYVT
ncbi:hypothetical protein [Streptomyces sp. NPDC001530]|uniref:hypothetical protein n=1 Tax=Streptomyces sp. NPDC001530 TaxID=3364582 RepID=UPI0036AE8E59